MNIKNTQPCMLIKLTVHVLLNVCYTGGICVSFIRVVSHKANVCKLIGIIYAQINSCINL